MSLTFVGQDGIVLGSNVIRKIVVKNKAEKSIEQRQIDLFVYLREHSFHENVTFALACFPNVGQVVDTLTPLKRIILI